MIFETTATPMKPFLARVKHLLCFLLLSMVAFPASSSAEYFPGPQDVLSALKFNSQGEIVFESQILSGNDPAVTPVAASEELLLAASGPSGEASPSDGTGAEEAEVDPYADDSFEEDPFGEKAKTDDDFEEDPFGDEAMMDNDFEEDPFAEDESEIEDIPDPLERWFNRPIYVFNDHFYEYFLRPVAQTYKDSLAENFRIMIRNLFHTVTFPGRLVSSLLQLKFDKAGRIIGRVLINCTLGFLCMVDVANEGFEIKPVKEDFGQVLGFYGISSGPYLVLPILGPSSVRDGVGFAVDALMNPLFWLVPDFTTGAGITSEEMVNEISFYIDDIEALKESALDPYISFREFYHQRREVLIDE